jgi:tetratricopeptide (TPR) repeat protein
MIDDLKANLDKDPADLTRYSDLVDAYLEAHRYEDADKMVQKMVQLEPSNPTTFETKAVYHETMGDIDAAADAWQKVTELEPNDSEAWEHLGTWREEQGRIEDAISAYRNAVKADPQTEGLQFSLAEILAEGEHYDEAAAIYVALVERHKEARNEQDEEVLADAYTGLASTLNIKGDYQEALKIATDYAQRFPDQPEAAYERASALSALGRHEDAVEAYELAIDGDPLNANAHADLAESYLAIGKKDKALEAAETAISLDPESSAAHETLAHAYVANGRQADAEAALAKAAALQADLDE